MSFKVIKRIKVVFTLVRLKLKPKDYVTVIKTITAACEDFENFKFDPRAPTACRVPTLVLKLIVKAVHKFFGGCTTIQII